MRPWYHLPSSKCWLGWLSRGFHRSTRSVLVNLINPDVWLLISGGLSAFQVVPTSIPQQPSLSVHEFLWCLYHITAGIHHMYLHDLFLATCLDWHENTYMCPYGPIGHIALLYVLSIQVHMSCRNGVLTLPQLATPGTGSSTFYNTVSIREVCNTLNMRHTANLVGKE